MKIRSRVFEVPGVLVMILLFMAAPIFAQEATLPAPDIRPQGTGQPGAWFVAANSAPLIGQPIRLLLNVEVPAGTESTVVWPDIPEDWPPFWVTQIGEVVPINNGSTVILQRPIIASLWEVGQFMTPDISVLYQSSAGLTTMHVESASFIVTSSLGADLELRPIKPQIWLSYIPAWIKVLAVGVFVVLVSALIWRLRRGVHLRQAFGTRTTPVGRALAELDALYRQNLNPFELFPLVADCLRRYIQERFDISAQDMTTAEVTAALHTQGHLPDQPQKELQRILEYADLVKFAAFQPGKQAAHQLIDAARAWLERAEAVAPAFVKESAADE